MSSLNYSTVSTVSTAVDAIALKAAGLSVASTAVASVASTVQTAELGLFQSVFTKGGVSSSFFSTGIGKLLTCLDNSTLRWKSRYAAAKSLTPMQRLAEWYNNIYKKSWHIDDAEQYMNFFVRETKGTSLAYSSDDQSHFQGHFAGVDNTGSLTVATAQLWNTLLDSKYFAGYDIYPNATVLAGYEADGSKSGAKGKVYYKSKMFLDVTKCCDYADVLAQAEAANENVTSTGTATASTGTSSSSDSSLYLIIAAIVAFIGIVFFSGKKKKH